ncbi:MAG: ABC transporter permease subunit [Bdellovibrionaceae bacterium]|jgi:ABC-2 type transport system permease protein|nr:ABC transporter permease subunit [Pseudobdellovibrionaceae bacterium]
MKTLMLVSMAEVRESFRAKWFLLYSLVFGGAIILLFSLGITESRVLGFTGLSRLLITYIQLCVAVLPLFILISTVRAVVADKENNVVEYFLSMPISLASYFWGKLAGKFFVVFLPVIVALLAASAWGFIKSLDVIWMEVLYYSVLLGTLTWCFLGFGMLISSSVKKQEWALGLAFSIWLILLIFLDIILIGIMLQHRISESLIIGISLLNPLQVFRTAAILLFDTEGAAIGPAAYVIVDAIGRNGFLLFSLLYPLSLGWLLSWAGFKIFKHGDIV